jgi:O-antigen/teichoic acid export membrane protein
VENTLTLKKRAIQGAFWTAASIFGVQLLNLLTTLILAKLLAPTDFGLVAVAQLVVTTAQIFRDLGLAQALIYRTDHIEEAANTAFVLVVIWGTLLFFLISITASQIARFFNEPGATAVIQAMAITLVISSFGTVPSALMEKELEFRKKVLPEILPVVTFALTTVALATAGYGVWSIVLGRIGQSTLTAILMWKASHWWVRLSFDRNIAVEILEYGKHIVGGSILNVVFLYIDNVYVGRISGVTALGFYTFAFALANLPTQTLTPTVNKVAFPSYVKLREGQADLSSAYLKSVRLVSMIAFPATLGLAAISANLLHILYGDKWNPTILLVQILSWYALFRSIGALPGTVFLAIGKQSLIPRLMMIYVTAVAVLLWPATTWFGAMGTSLVMTGVIGIGSLVWLLLANYYLDISLERFARTVAPQTVSSAIMVVWLLTLGSLLKESPLSLAILIGSGAVLYITSLLLLTKGQAYEEVASVVKALLISGPSQTGA